MSEEFSNSLSRSVLGAQQGYSQGVSQSCGFIGIWGSSCLYGRICFLVDVELSNLHFPRPAGKFLISGMVQTLLKGSAE